jgi:hypothetical protein
VIWGVEQQTYHVHSQGLVSDIDPAHPGMECYSGEQDNPTRWLHSAGGELIADETILDLGLSPKAVYWDADPQRELLVDGRIYDFEADTTHLSGVGGRQVAWVDILGDWLEEIVVSVEGELRIYTNDPGIRPAYFPDGRSPLPYGRGAPGHGIRTASDDELLPGRIRTVTAQRGHKSNRGRMRLQFLLIIVKLPNKVHFRMRMGQIEVKCEFGC